MQSLRQWLSLNSKVANKAHLADLGITELEGASAVIGITTYGDLGFAVSDSQNPVKIEEGREEGALHQSAPAVCVRVHGDKR